jgi:putative phosphoesterase
LKNILLISDTHGFLDEKLLKHIHAADEVWHAGDIGDPAIASQIERMKPFRAVYGNIDGPEIRNRFPEDEFFTIESVKVLMTHIAGTPANYSARVKNLISLHRPDVLICGHSHILKVEYSKQHGLLHLNPGAAGVQGFHHVKTALRFEISGAEIKNLAVIELGRRTSVT